MAGSVAQSWVKQVTPGSHLGVLTFTCVGDASNGSFPATATEHDIVGEVLGVVTNPGATAPTDNWDLALNDADGADVLGGQGANRHTTNSQRCVPIFGSVYAPQAVNGKLTLAITGNSVNEAAIVVKVFVRRV